MLTNMSSLKSVSKPYTGFFSVLKSSENPVKSGLSDTRYTTAKNMFENEHFCELV